VVSIETTPRNRAKPTASFPVDVSRLRRTAFAGGDYLRRL
jgi:hypothetical protein